MGVHICVALATIMLVWFGVQEALASAQGGPGFSMGKFLSFFMLITFAYTMVKFYDSSIPGIGYSLKGFINGGAQYLVNQIGTDSADQHLEHIAAGSDERRAGHDVHGDESVQRDHLRADTGAHCRSLRAYQRHHRLRRSRQFHRRDARADLHSVPCLRQVGLPVLGLASRLSWLLFLQSCRGRDIEHPVAIARALLRHDERLRRSGDDGRSSFPC